MERKQYKCGLTVNIATVFPTMKAQSNNWIWHCPWAELVSKRIFVAILNILNTLKVHFLPLDLDVLYYLRGALLKKLPSLLAWSTKTRILMSPVRL